MAFTGTPVVTRLGHLSALITGVTLGTSASGVVGLDGSGDEVELPSDFPTVGDSGLTLDKLVTAQVVSVGTGGGTVADVRVTVGTAPNRWTFTNASGASATGSLRILIEYHGTIER